MNIYICFNYKCLSINFYFHENFSSFIHFFVVFAVKVRKSYNYTILFKKRAMERGKYNNCAIDISECLSMKIQRVKRKNEPGIKPWSLA